MPTAALHNHQTMKEQLKTVTIGVDPHKGSHTAHAIDEREIEQAELRVRSGSKQLERLLGWAEQFGERTWAIENATGLGYLLAQQLVAAGEHEVLVYRIEGRLVGLANRCSHAGWPLAEGEVADGCITCPHHGSVFRLTDGSVVRGPAASPQLRYEVRERAGRIEVRGSR